MIITMIENVNGAPAFATLSDGTRFEITKKDRDDILEAFRTRKSYRRASDQASELEPSSSAAGDGSSDDTTDEDPNAIITDDGVVTSPPAVKQPETKGKK